MTDKINFNLDLAEDAMEDKNKALGTIIRKARAIISKTDIPGELQEFWDETPMNTIQIRELFKMDRATFSHHFNRFKDFMTNKHSKTIIPLIEWSNWPDVYTKWIVREFLLYMNRDKIKYEIVL